MYCEYILQDIRETRKVPLDIHTNTKDERIASLDLFDFNQILNKASSEHKETIKYIIKETSRTQECQ